MNVPMQDTLKFCKIWNVSAQKTGALSSQSESRSASPAPVTTLTQVSPLAALTEIAFIMQGGHVVLRIDVQTSASDQALQFMWM
jgi:hypothetical protein